MRPLESIKWDAKMVLMRVDLPSPVWPVICQYGDRSHLAAELQLTNADDVELETALQQLSLNLRCDAVETNVASREDGVGLLRHTGSSHGELIDGIG